MPLTRISKFQSLCVWGSQNLYSDKYVPRYSDTPKIKNKKNDLTNYFLSKNCQKPTMTFVTLENFDKDKVVLGNIYSTTKPMPYKIVPIQNELHDGL